MINNMFFQKFPFTANYFSTLLNCVFEDKRNFPQSIIFEGSNTKLQYLFSLELARILNCQKNKEQNCNCINCSWIKSYSHPSITNVSQIHFKPEGDETKTVISVKQANEIEKNLMLSSDHHRFFIFFSSGLTKYAQDELRDFSLLGYDTNIDFLIQPLDYSTFHSKTLNALLKSIEEPAANTTFVFLAKSKEDILPTIVSRSVVFKLNGEKQRNNYSFLEDVINCYLKISVQNAFDISEKMLNILVQKNLKIEFVLNLFMESLMDLLKQNIKNDSSVIKIKNDIDIVKTAIKQARANMQDKIVLDTMCLKLARGY